MYSQIIFSLNLNAQYTPYQILGNMDNNRAKIFFIHLNCNILCEYPQEEHKKADDSKGIHHFILYWIASSSMSQHISPVLSCCF